MEYDTTCKKNKLPMILLHRWPRPTYDLNFQCHMLCYFFVLYCLIVVNLPTKTPSIQFFCLLQFQLKKLFFTSPFHFLIQKCFLVGGEKLQINFGPTVQNNTNLHRGWPRIQHRWSVLLEWSSHVVLCFPWSLLSGEWPIML